MKAIRVHEFGGPEVLRLEDAEDPKPGAGQVLVLVRAWIAANRPRWTGKKLGSFEQWSDVIGGLTTTTSPKRRSA